MPVIATAIWMLAAGVPVKAQSTTAQPHKLAAPEDFSALWMSAKMSPSDVFAALLAEKQNERLVWVKQGIDDKCQRVMVTAEHAIRGRVVKSDSRPFKLVVSHALTYAGRSVPGTQFTASGCHVNFIGETIAIAGCTGPDGVDGAKKVLDEFRERVGAPDEESGTRAVWYCSSKKDETTAACVVTIGSRETSCGQPNPCSMFELRFTRNTLAEATKIEGQAADLLKNRCVN